MRINDSTTQLISNSLSQTSRAISRSLERLSSGKRINSARDDVAGYSLSVNLEAQSRGLLQANRNINDALGISQTAESALSVQLDILQRMRELALQGASDLLSSNDRENINSQLTALRDEFSRISNETEFNGKRLLDGSLGAASFQIGTQSDDNLEFSFQDLKASEVFTREVGTGIFEAQTEITVGGDVGATQLADMNNDGNLDIVVADPVEDYVGVALGNGDGSFQSLMTFARDDAYDLTIADFNADGILDVGLLEVGAPHKVSVLLGNGDGSLSFSSTTEISLSFFSNIESGDFDGDGDIDLAVGEATALINYIENLGDGDFGETAVSITTSANIAYTDVADFNNDGIDDIFAASGSSSQVIFGDESGGMQEGATFTVSGSIFELGDFNSDGNIDVLSFLGPTAYYYAGNGDGSFETASTFAIAGSGGHSDSIDINADGNLDFVVADGSNYYTYLGDGTGSFSFAASDSASITDGDGFDHNLVMGDLNNDGVVDLVGGDASRDIEVLLARTDDESSLAELKVDTNEDATVALSIIDNAIDTIIDNQASFGRLTNRLESIYNSNQIQREQLESSRSNITDADFALETAELVRQQVLQQAQIAALGQANLNMQIVLNLFQ